MAGLGGEQDLEPHNQYVVDTPLAAFKALSLWIGFISAHLDGAVVPNIHWTTTQVAWGLRINPFF